MPDIVAAILTKNEAAHIADCIKSVQWVDRVIVEDSFSDDGTVAIAEDLGAQVFQNEFVNFSAARNRTLNNIRDLGVEWVLFVDADERVTPELAQEIRQVIGKGDTAGWWIPRYNVMWGHIMQGGGWYPDCQLRLMRVEAAHYDPERQVHEIVILDGQADYLKEHLMHYNYDSLAQFKFKQDRYIDFEAKILKEKGIRAKPWTYLTMPIREFLRRYISLNGYKDGWVGLQICSLMSWYMFVTYLRSRKLYQTD
jgi:glycosyltransferase involved in cell wall biosynthesis